MSKLLENKDTVRIVVESVVLLGVVFYFSNKNKKMMEHIGDLTQRLEEQEDRIEKLEKLMKLTEDNYMKPVNKVNKPKPVFKSLPKPVVVPLQPVNEDEISIESDDSDNEIVSERESELDSLIKNELQELKDDLKKE
jgi:hypothetical protein